MEEKQRLDILLVERGLVKSRELAKTLITSGKVFVDGEKRDKASFKTDLSSNITVKETQLKYVSRGGYKLEKAIEYFDISLKNTVCMDIGASTGGFTDCMLQNGAAKVFSVDVGYDQLDEKLRADERVLCMEKTNIRYLTKEDINQAIDFASMDVSFISLTKVLLPVKELLGNDGALVCLIKPQFEAGKENVGKKGVVKDKKIHREVIKNVLEFAVNIGFNVLGLTYSPIKGPEGNIEYLVYLHKSKVGLSAEKIEKLSREVVESSHNTEF